MMAGHDTEPRWKIISSDDRARATYCRGLYCRAAALEFPAEIKSAMPWFSYASDYMPVERRKNSALRVTENLLSEVLQHKIQYPMVASPVWQPLARIRFTGKNGREVRCSSAGRGCRPVTWGDCRVVSPFSTPVIATARGGRP